MSTVAVVVLAAGVGARFGEPKQFQELLPGLRLVDAAVESAARNSDHVVLVVPPGHDWRGRSVARVVAGGLTRLESVVSGLDSLPEDVDVVILHDAAHPLAPDRIFSDAIAAIEEGADGAVPFLPAAEVVKRRASDGTLSTVGRDDLGLAQMPMGFRPAALRASHEALAEGFIEYKEDAMLLEQQGLRVVAIPGSSENVHVVSRGDLEIARVLAAGLAMFGGVGFD